MHTQRLRVTPLRSIIGTLGLLLLAMACEDDEPRVIGPITMETGSQQGGSGGNSPSGSGGSSGGMQPSATGGSGDTPNVEMGGSSSVENPDVQPPANEGPEVEVVGEINQDATWTADKVYLLTGTEPVFVVGNHTLTIEPGTVIKGQGLGTALVVTRGSRLVANGTADKPIVFTSGVIEGLRNPGDWGGVVLLGSAPLNDAKGAIEGISGDDERGAYGGPAQGEGDPTSDCGSLQYVRIEFAGFQYVVDQELNGLTLGGCGSDTLIDYVQIHRGFDDGIEIFGGTVDIKHAVITNSTDDGLDWDRGWQGRGQFIIVRTDPSVSDSGIEADNRENQNGNTPISNPTLYNLTIVGDKGSPNPGMVLRRGTKGLIRDSIIMGFTSAAIDIRDPLSVAAAQAGELDVSASIFFNNGAGGTAHADTKPDGTTTDDALDEGPWLADGARFNKIDVDPLLPLALNQTAPVFMPPAESPAATGALPIPANDPFFDVVTYIGAIQPGGTDWTAGWTAYPAR